MRISATIATMASIFVGGVMTTLLIIFMLGCNPQSTQQQPQWPPVVTFESAELSGQLEIDTPAGPVLIDVSTGLVSGEGEAAVRRADISAEVSFAINGARQYVHLASLGGPAGEEWAQCLTAEARVDVVAGLGVEITARPPGLHESCGPASMEVQTPLGNWSTASTVDDADSD